MMGTYTKTEEFANAKLGAFNQNFEAINIDK